jgi:ParB family chromosome partitioning protein
MDATKPRLGRGLDSLLGDGSHDNTRGDWVAVERIKHNPYQPRKRFDEEELNQLRDSIKTHGVLQPLVVRKTGEEFQLIAGERRLRAAQAAGLGEVPVHVVEFDDQQVFEAALVENIHRSDLNPIEKAQGFKEYLEKFNLTQDQLGAKLGLDRTTISNLLGLLNLPGEVQDAVRLGQISLGHAKVLKGIGDTARQVSLCKEVILKNLSVHALEQLAKEIKQGGGQDGAETGQPHAAASRSAEKTAHVVSLENELKQRLATRVEIRVKAKDKGQIVIGFDSNDDFERIIEALKR